MKLDLYEALIKHLNFFWEHYAESPIIYIGNIDGDELISITDTLSFCVAYNIPYEEYEDKGTCIRISISKKGTNAKVPAIGIDFIDIETHFGFEYGYPFADMKEGACRCVEIIHSVYGVRDENQIKIRTEIGGRIYNTESLLRQELKSLTTNAKNTQKKAESSTNQVSKRQKGTTVGQKVALLTCCCVLLFIIYMFAKEIVWQAYKDYSTSYKVTSSGIVDTSKMIEWNARINKPEDLPEQEGIFLWCLKKGSQLTNNLLPLVGISEIEFRTVIYNGEKVKVLKVARAVTNLKQDILQDFLGPSQSDFRAALGVMALKEPLPTEKPVSTSERYRIYREFNEADELEISKWMADNLHLLYSTTVICGESYDQEKELYKLLAPPFNLYESLSGDSSNSTFKHFMSRAVEVSNLEKFVKHYNETTKKAAISTFTPTKNENADSDPYDNPDFDDLIPGEEYDEEFVDRSKVDHELYDKP